MADGKNKYSARTIEYKDGKEHVISVLGIAKNRFNSARAADRNERILSSEDTRFAINDDGCQWDDATRKIREEAAPPRPCLVMNKIPEKIDQAEGEFRKLKPSIKVKAVDNKADPKIAEIIAGIIRHIEYNSNARAAYNTSHSCVLHGGRGAWRINVEDAKDDPFEKDIIIERVPNPLSVTWDQSAKKVDRSDARFMFISEDILEETFKSKYPNAAMAGWSSDDLNNGWRADGVVRVCEYWWKEEETVEAYRVQRGDVEETVWELKEGETPKEVKKVKKDKIKWFLMSGLEILEGPFEDWLGRHIPIILEFGKETNVNGICKTRGMVRFGKEPQRMYNYWTSTEAESIALAPKAPYLATAAMIGKYKEMWDTASTKNWPYLLFDHDPKMPGAAPKREMPPQVSTAMIQAKATMEHDIMSAMNVYAASLGDQGQETSGVAIQARQRQGSIGGFGYTDNFETSLIWSAKVLMDLIQPIYSSERIIRIRGESGSEHVVPINMRRESPIAQNQMIDESFIVNNEGSEYINDLSIGKYDIVATIGPSYTTQREESLDTLLRVLETMPRLAEISADLIVGLLDMPMSDELMVRAKKLVPQNMRSLEPGEEQEQPQGPSPEEMFKMKEIEIKFQEQQRKDFETSVNSILTLAKAEAEEEGTQMPQYMAQVEQMFQKFQQSQQPQGVA